MKHILILFYFFCTISMFGNNTNELKTITKYSKKITEKHILNKLETLIKLNENEKCFLLEKNHLIIFSPGIIKKSIISDEYIQISKEHSMLEYKYEPIKITFKKIKKSKFEMHIDMQLKIKEKNNLESIKLGFVPTIQFDKIIFNNDKYEHLLPNDYFTFNNAIKENIKEKVYIFSEILYVSPNDNFNTNNVLEKLSTYIENGKKIKSNQYSNYNLTNHLKNNGFKLYNNVFLQEKDIQNLTNLKSGMIFIDNNWIKKDEYEANENLKIIYEQYLSNPDKYLEMLLITLNKYNIASASEKEKIQRSIDKHIIQLTNNINTEKQLSEIKESMQYDLLFVNVNKKNILNAIDNKINSIKTENIKKKQKQAETIKGKLKEIYTTIKNKKQLQIFCIIEKIDNCKSIFSKNLIKQLDQYIYLLALSNNNFEEINTLIKNVPEEHYNFLKSKLVKKCRYCNKGYKRCSHCKDTKQCPTCRGTGEYYVATISGDDRAVSCDPVCRECATPKKCIFCKGSSFLINKNLVKKYQKQFKESLLINIEKEITKISSD